MRVAIAFTFLAVIGCGTDTPVTPSLPRITIAGDGQSGEEGLSLPQPLVVHLATADGAPITNKEIDWTVSSGGGWLRGSPSTTDASGNASINWIVGEALLPQKVTATVADYSRQIEFTAVAVPRPPLGLPLQNRLVFFKDDGIVTTALDGSDLHRLSFERVAICPALSPDSRSIAYLTLPTADNYAWSLFLMHADGTARTKLTDPAGYRTCPFWSPDGQHIAFEDETVANRSVWVYSRDGQQEAHFPIVGEIGGFSPAGDRLVYWREHDAGTPLRGVDVYSVSITGTDTKLLTAGSSPSWARDVDLIAFECTGLCVMSGDGAQINKIVSDPYVVRPAISPNGALIAYTCSGGSLCIVSSSGTAVARVSDALPADWVSYRWSPDSKMLAYECVYVTGGGNFVNLRIDLCTVNADGTNFRNLTNDESAEQFASFAVP